MNPLRARDGSRETVALLVGLLMLGWSGSAIGGDISAGKAKSAACATCHGSKGIGTAPLYPDLAGQKSLYLVKQLQDYRDGRRQDEMMAVVAQTLTDEDIEDLAAFYESLPCATDE